MVIHRLDLTKQQRKIEKTEKRACKKYQNLNKKEKEK